MKHRDEGAAGNGRSGRRRNRNRRRAVARAIITKAPLAVLWLGHPLAIAADLNGCCRKPVLSFPFPSEETTPPLPPEARPFSPPDRPKNPVARKETRGTPPWPFLLTEKAQGRRVEASVVCCRKEGKPRPLMLGESGERPFACLFKCVQGSE